MTDRPTHPPAPTPAPTSALPDLTGAGTDEAAWRASGVLDTLPDHDPTAAPPARVVVVAPHPDDEVLGVGGVLALLAARGVPVVVVGVTDGEASHPDSPTLRPAELVARRRTERTAALAALGAPGAEVVAAGLPDGGVAGHEEALADTLAVLLRPDDLCLAPLVDDGHPDHDAAGRAAREAAGRVGTRVEGYAVWRWHWARPAPPGDASRAGAVRVALPAATHAAKRAAVDCFTTQIAPLSDDPRDAAILPPPVLARLTREIEVLWR